MTIITKLKLKITFAVVVVLSIVFGLIVFAINFISFRSVENENKVFLTNLIEKDATNYVDTNLKIISEFSLLLKEQHHSLPKTQTSTNNKFLKLPFENQTIRNYFTVRLSDQGKILQIVSEFPLHYTNDEIKELIESVFDSGKPDSTYLGMRYMIVKRPYGFLAAFTEIKTESNLRSRLIRVSFQIYVLSMFIAVFVAWFFSVWAVKPVQQSFEKQRQFVADASHELKTPLSVISANIDVLSSEIGENKWIDYIRTESNRMNLLIKDLLYLAKTDDVKEPYNPMPFDLSRIIMCTVLPFESVAYDQGKTLETDIQENVQFLGVQKRIEQLLVILLDNAIKYSEEHAIIKVKLKTAGSKKIISVYNSGDGINPESLKHIFERFYRVDTSRNRGSGGFGLGLSIAQSIVQAHHGKIQVLSEVGKYTEVEVIL